MTRQDVLDNASKCVNGDREQDYGSPENNFKTIAVMWNAYIRASHRQELEAKDVAAMMAIVKICRISTGNAKADNWIDLAGYAACGGEGPGKDRKTGNPADGKACLCFFPE